MNLYRQWLTKNYFCPFEIYAVGNINVFCAYVFSNKNVQKNRIMSVVLFFLAFLLNIVMNRDEPIPVSAWYACTCRSQYQVTDGTCVWFIDK